MLGQGRVLGGEVERSLQVVGMGLHLVLEGELGVHVGQLVLLRRLHLVLSSHLELLEALLLVQKRHRQLVVQDAQVAGRDVDQLGGVLALRLELLLMALELQDVAEILLQELGLVQAWLLWHVDALRFRRHLHLLAVERTAQRGRVVEPGLALTTVLTLLVKQTLDELRLQALSGRLLELLLGDDAQRLRLPAVVREPLLRLHRQHVVLIPSGIRVRRGLELLLRSIRLVALLVEWVLSHAAVVIWSGIHSRECSINRSIFQRYRKCLNL